MKKKNLVILILLLGIVLLSNGCATTNNQRYFSGELIAPDPSNPFQGTWTTNILTNSFVHVINGMKGEMYWYTSTDHNWHKRDSYTIIPNNDGFITSNNWQISVTKTNDGDILTVDKIQYKRYK